MTNVYHSLALTDFWQDWTDTSQITTSDDWSGVASIVGYRGDSLTGSTGTDPQTIAGTSTVVDVNANQTNPNTFTTGGVTEFHLANPVVALTGSGTARAPYLQLHLDATGRQDVALSFALRDIDGSTDNAVQPIAVQYRTDPNGAWINVPAAFVPDASTGPSLATQVTNVSVVLPAGANNAATLQVRIITTDAVGSDEWIGIDDISVTSDPIVVNNAGSLSIADASIAEGDSGTAELVFTVNRLGGDDGAISATWNLNLEDSADSADLAAGQALTGTVSFADGQTSATITVLVAGDILFEPNETFTLTLTEPLGGATLTDAAATGTILNDDPAPPAGDVFINEIHYDDAGADIGERIEVAGPAGTSLAGWSLVLYNGNGGASYATIVLSGIIPNQDDGYGTLSFPGPGGGIQNGAPDGVALVDAGGNVVQFLSYEGSFTATNGPASGITSTDIGVAEEPAVADGFSLQLAGSGAVYGDFHWVAARDDNFGSVNTGQDFIGADATGLVTINDVSLVEGNSGTGQMVFTVRRAGGLNQEASVDWQVSLTGSADAADLGAGQPLFGHIDFGVGVSAVQVVVNIAGDTLGEDNETFQVLLANPAGNIAIVDGAGVGTIDNDDPVPRAIYEIQGEGHLSAYDGQPVITTGIVTSVVFNGFYLQDAVGDGNASTSDGIFVFTGGAPAVAVGDAAVVTGSVNEFRPGALGLTITEIEAFGPGAVVVQSSGNALPAATLIGAGGVLPPTSIIDDDGLVYDPENDGIDFYESLEGMLVTVDAPQVVHNSTTQFGETWVVASGGVGATGMNERGGITIGDGDMNPERILIVDQGGPFLTQGDQLADVTGIMSYGFDHYRLLADNVTVTSDVTVSREDSDLVGGRDHLTVASYNVQNLDPGDAAGGKFDLLADDIVYSLNAPDIIAVQEMQDGDPNGSATLSAALTAQMLIDEIVERGGPNYIYVEIAPTAPGQTGGEPGGNIRNGYFYNPDRVSLVAGSLALIEGPAFSGNVRRPLVADFEFNGETVTLINVHLTARLGGPPAWGGEQPAADAGDAARTAQATAIRAWVNDQLATDPSLKLGVLGDFNGFWFEDSVAALEAGGVMTDLHRLLPEAERYTARFDGNAQGIDHFVVTGNLVAGGEFDAVHRNAEQPFGVPIGTDHDPIIARFYIEHPNEAPVAVADSVSVDEDDATGNLWNLLLGNDTDPDPEDVLAIQSVDGTGTLGTLVFDAASQSLVYVADDDAFDMLAPGETFVDTFTYTVADPDGLTGAGTVSVTVTGVADGVSVDGGNGADRIEGGAGEDVLSGGNGSDIVFGDDGHDVLSGGNGDDFLWGGDGRDVLRGGHGPDMLEGGAGGDLFVFGQGGGPDLVLDYEAGIDRILLEDGIAVKSVKIGDADNDGVTDLSIAFTNGGGSVLLLGVSSLAQVDFADPADLANYPPF